MRWTKAALSMFCALAVMCAGRQLAARDLTPGIVGADDRVRIENESAPWAAIGQVNVAGYRVRSRCTGTLVAPDLVLTAAHCLIDPARKTPYPLHSIHFVAGVRKSQNKGHSTAKCLHFPQGYDYAGPERVRPRGLNKLPLKALAQDIAAIVLNDPLDVDPASIAEPMAVGPGTALVHAAIPPTGAFVLSAHKNLPGYQGHRRRTLLAHRLRHPSRQLRRPGLRRDRRRAEAGRDHGRHDRRLG
ncbi:MAG: trypsin-like serine protease [Rhodomicrobium sp.]|nr:trypsin-like serine protease [Rhodomicrobium sp.]